MKRYKRKFTEEKDFALTIAEFVGANISFDISRFHLELSPYIKRYTDLYRMWSDYTMEDFIKKNYTINLRPTGYLSTSTDLDSIRELCEELGEECLISTHSGKGINPYIILQNAIKQGHRESNYLKDVLRNNSYQNEIILLDRVTKLNHSNVVGYYDGDDIIFV